MEEEKSMAMAAVSKYKVPYIAVYSMHSSITHSHEIKDPKMMHF